MSTKIGYFFMLFVPSLTQFHLLLLYKNLYEKNEISVGGMGKIYKFSSPTGIYTLAVKLSHTNW